MLQYIMLLKYMKCQNELVKSVHHTGHGCVGVGVTVGFSENESSFLEGKHLQIMLVLNEELYYSNNIGDFSEEEGPWCGGRANPKAFGTVS